MELLNIIDLWDFRVRYLAKRSLLSFGVFLKQNSRRKRNHVTISCWGCSQIMLSLVGGGLGHLCNS